MKHPFLRLSLVMLGLAAAFSVAGCHSAPEKKDSELTKARFFVEASDGDKFASAILPISGVRIAIDGKPVITEFDIVHVEAAKSDMGQFLIFQLTNDAARDLYRFTGDHQGRRLVLAINGRALGARMIDQPFSSGVIAVFPEVPEEELPKLITELNSTSVDLQARIAKAKS